MFRRDWLPDWARTGTSITRASSQNSGSNVKPGDETPGDHMSSQQDSLMNGQPERHQIRSSNSGQNGVPTQSGGDVPLDNLNRGGVAIQPAQDAIVVAVDPDRDRSVK